MLLADVPLGFFPFDAERGIRKHVVEGPRSKGVIQETVSKCDLTGVMPSQERIGFTDCVRFRIQLLPVNFKVCCRTALAHVLLSGGQHATSAASGIVERLAIGRVISENE